MNRTVATPWTFGHRGRRARTIKPARKYAPQTTMNFAKCPSPVLASDRCVNQKTRRRAISPTQMLAAAQSRMLPHSFHPPTQKTPRIRASGRRINASRTYWNALISIPELEIIWEASAFIPFCAQANGADAMSALAKKLNPASSRPYPCNAGMLTSCLRVSPGR